MIAMTNDVMIISVLTDNWNVFNKETTHRCSVFNFYFNVSIKCPTVAMQLHVHV